MALTIYMATNKINLHILTNTWFYCLFDLIQSSGRYWYLFSINLPFLEGWWCWSFSYASPIIILNNSNWVFLSITSGTALVNYQMVSMLVLNSYLLDSPSMTVGTERGHQRADRLKPQSQTTSQSDHMDYSLVQLNETISHAMWGHLRRMDHGGEFWHNVVHWRREWQTTSLFLPWEPHEAYEKAKR